MRFLVAVALIVLIVGIVDESFAKKLKRPNAQQILGKVKLIAKAPVLKSGSSATQRLARSAEEDSDSDESLSEECAKNGGPEAYNHAEASIEAAMTQALEALDDDGAFDRTVNDLDDEDDFVALVGYLCQRKNVIQTFATSVADAAKPCFDAESREGIDTLTNLTNSFVEYVCQENGERVTHFLRSDGLTCVNDNQESLMNCTNNIIDSSEEDSSAVNEINTDDTDCTQLTDARNCIDKELKTCSDHASADFLVGLIDFFLDRLCEESKLIGKAASLAIGF